MAKQLSVKEILALNPHLDVDEVMELMQRIEAAGDASEDHMGYRLVSPTTKQKVFMIEDDDRCLHVLTTRQTG